MNKWIKTLKKGDTLMCIRSVDNKLLSYHRYIISIGYNNYHLENHKYVVEDILFGGEMVRMCCGSYLRSDQDSFFTFNTQNDLFVICFEPV